MRKLISSILFLLTAASVSTASYAVRAVVKYNGVVVATSNSAATPTATQDLFSSTLWAKDGVTPVKQCSVAPCTINVKGLFTPGDYSSGGVPVLRILSGAYAEAKVTSNNQFIKNATSITNSTNVAGTFIYLGPPSGSLEIEVTNEFALHPVNGTDLGTWRTLGKGASKCVKNSSGKWVSSSCSLTSASLDSGACTLCRAYGYTEEGYVLRPDLVNVGQQLPAAGVTVTMKSAVQFKNTATTPLTTAELSIIGVNSSLVHDIPISQFIEDAHFYVSLSEQANVPCEPQKFGTSNVAGTCAALEIKKSTIAFSNMNPNDQVNLPPTGTDVAAPNEGVLNAILGSKINIDTQPIAVIEDPDNQGFFIAKPNPAGAIVESNSDWNVGSSGTKQVVALSVPAFMSGNTVITNGVDACKIEPFIPVDPNDPNSELIPNVFLSVAGSALFAVLPFDSSDPRKMDLRDFNNDGKCDGQVFKFSMTEINASIPGADTTAKQQTCFANPNVTLLAGADVVSFYDVLSAKKGGKKAAYGASEECVAPSGTGSVAVSCDVHAQVGGIQAVLCAPRAGGN